MIKILLCVFLGMWSFIGKGQDSSYTQVEDINYRTTLYTDTYLVEDYDSLISREQRLISKYCIFNTLLLKMDSNPKTQLLYCGLPDTVRVISKNGIDTTIFANQPSTFYDYYNPSCFVIPTITNELMELPYNSGVYVLTLLFEKSKRKVTVEIDTKFLEVYIEPLFDVYFEKFIDDGEYQVDENGLPVPLKTRDVKAEDEVIIQNKGIKQKTGENKSKLFKKMSQRDRKKQLYLWYKEMLQK